MTHTYLRKGEDQYDIGLWLRHPAGHDRFSVLFSVASIYCAFTAVNALNGGERVSPEALQLEENTD